MSIEHKFHFIEIEQIEYSMDGNILFHFKKGRLDKDRQYHVRQSFLLNIEPRNALIGFLTTVRRSIRDVTVGFPENYLTVNLSATDLEELDKKDNFQSPIANGLLATYYAICHLKQIKPDKYFVSLVKSLDSSGCKHLDLSMWPGLEEGQEKVQMVVLALQYNTFFEVLTIKDVKCPTISKFVCGIIKHNSKLRKIIVRNNGTLWTHELGGSLVLNNQNKVSVLDISNNEIKPNGVAFLANALSKYSHALKVLNLENMKITSEGFTQIFEALLGNLGLSICISDLNISKNTMDEKSSETFIKWFQEIASRNAELKRLSIAKLNLGLGKFVGIIKKLSNIEYLNLSENRFDKTTENELISLGKHSKQLKILRLKNCSIPPEPMKHILESLFANSALSGLHLDISKNFVGEKGELICSALSKAKNLEIIDLSSLGIGLKCGAHLVESLPAGITAVYLNKNFTSEEIKLSNENLSSSAFSEKLPLVVSNFFKSLQRMFEIRPTLTYFSMKGSEQNRLEHYLIGFFKILKGNYTLLHIDIRDQNCGPVAFQKLCRVLLSNKSLQTVKAEGNGLSFQSFLQAKNTILNNSSLVNFSVLKPTFNLGIDQPLLDKILQDIISMNSIKSTEKEIPPPPKDEFKFNIDWSLGKSYSIPVLEGDLVLSKKGFIRSRSRLALNRKPSISGESGSGPQKAEKFSRSKSQAAVNNPERAVPYRKISDPSRPKRKKVSSTDDEKKKKGKNKKSEELSLGVLSPIEDTPVKDRSLPQNIPLYPQTATPSDKSESKISDTETSFAHPKDKEPSKLPHTFSLPEDVWTIVVAATEDHDYNPHLPPGCSAYKSLDPSEFTLSPISDGKFVISSDDTSRLEDMPCSPSALSISSPMKVNEAPTPSPQKSPQKISEPSPYIPHVINPPSPTAPNSGAVSSATPYHPPTNSTCNSSLINPPPPNDVPPPLENSLDNNPFPDVPYRRRSLPNFRASIVRRTAILDNSLETLHQLSLSPEETLKNNPLPPTDLPPPPPIPQSQSQSQSLPNSDSISPPTIPMLSLSPLEFPFSTKPPIHPLLQQPLSARPVLQNVPVYRHSTILSVRPANVPPPNDANNHVKPGSMHRPFTRADTIAHSGSGGPPELLRTESQQVFSLAANLSKVGRKGNMPTSVIEKAQKENKPSDDLDDYLYNLELQQFSTQRSITRNAWG